MPSAPLLPTIPLHGCQITRLIIGGNPFRGYSHFSADLDREMQSYYTQENMVKALFDVERAGINCMLSRGDQIIFGAVRAYREQGGAMHWLCQTASEHPDFRENVREIAGLKPLAIYHHGTRTDAHWKAGQIDVVRDRLKVIRDTGAAVGLASHMPEVFDHVEQAGWDVDFYMGCLYNLSREDRESMLVSGKRSEDRFVDSDREVMCRFIRTTERPCLAFKILASRRKCESQQMVRKAFQFAFDRIKPSDAVVVGMMQKDRNEAAADAEIVRSILSEQVERAG
jgi:hypothetical protein